MYLRTLGTDIPDSVPVRKRLNPNDPRMAMDADFQSAWNPIVIARHVIQHRKTPLYNRYEFPEVNKVLLPGQWDWLNREEPVLNPLPAGAPIPTGVSQSVQAARQKIASGKSPMKKLGMAIGEIASSGLLGEETDVLGGFRHFAMPQMTRPARVLRRHRYSFPGMLHGEEPAVLGGWLKRMKRKASNLSHQALNVATQIPVVGTYASMARAAGDLAHGELPSLNTIMGAAMPISSAGGLGNVGSLLSKAKDIAGGALGNLPGGISDLASSASNLVQGVAAGAGVPASDAANNFLDAANAVPANAGAYYSTPTGSNLQALDKTAGMLAVPENLPARVIAREVVPSKAEQESWAKKHEKALIVGSIALAGLAAAGGFAYYKKHKKQVEVPAIGEF